MCFGACRIGMRQVVDQLSMGQETQSQEQRTFASSSFAGVGGSAMSASAGGSMGTYVLAGVRVEPLLLLRLITPNAHVISSPLWVDVTWYRIPLLPD